MPVDPEFRRQITGSPVETPYDTASYKEPANPTLPEFGGVKLAQNDEEFLLLELLPAVATGFLKNKRKAEYEAAQAAAPKEAPKAEAAKEAAPAGPQITGPVLKAPMGGTVLEIKVKAGDKVNAGDIVMVYEAMKMENDLNSDKSGVVKRILVGENDVIATDQALIEFE